MWITILEMLELQKESRKEERISGPGRQTHWSKRLRMKSRGARAGFRRVAVFNEERGWLNEIDLSERTAAVWRERDIGGR